MATLKEIIEYSKANPESDYAKTAYEHIVSGEFDEQAQKEGIDLSPFGRPKASSVSLRSSTNSQQIGQNESLGKQIGKAVLNPISKIGGSVAKTILPESMEGSLASGQVKGVLGDNIDLVGYKDGQKLTPQETAKDIAGTALEGVSYLPMGGAVVATGKSVLSRQLPKFIQLAKEGAKSGALSQSGQSLQEGESFPQAALEGAGGAIVGGITAPAIGVPVGAIGSKIAKGVDVITKPVEAYKNNVLLNINKALSIQGKKSIGQAVNVAPEKRFTAFETLYDLAPEIKVKDEFGQEVPFSPTEANFQQFGEALYKAKNNIWSKVTNSLKQATNQGIEVDVTPALDDINRLITDVGVPMDVKRQAQELSDEITSFVTEKGTAPIEALARFNSYLNKKITGQITGTSNNATREVEAITAKNLSEAVDNAIEGLSGKEFAQLKDQYSSLKAIENDTVRRMQQELRMLDTGLADFMGNYGTSEMIGGLISAAQGNPANLVKGISTKVLGDYMKTLRQPSKYLRDAFIQIDKFKKGEGIIPAVQELKKNTKLNRGSLSLNPEDWFQEIANSAEVGLKAKTKELQLDMAKEAARTMRNNGVSVEVPNPKNAVEILKQAKELARKKKVSDIIQAETPSDKMKPFLESKKNELDLLKSLTPKQLERFNAGTKEEQKKALEYLKLKNDLETNDAIIAPKKKVADSLEQEAKKPPIGLPKTFEELVDNANKYQPQFKEAVTSVAKNLGFDVKIGNPKLLKTFKEKSLRPGEENFTIKDARDGNRATILVSSEKDLSKVEQEIAKQFEVSRVKNKFGSDYPYKSAIINVKTPAGHEAEIAITTPKMWEAKVTEGDALYRVVRAGAKGWEEAEKKMLELYRKAN